MARNIEIKARITDIDTCMHTAEKLSGSTPDILHQTDYFFYCSNGRLKLRVFSPEKGELIFYKRDDCTGPGTSEYEISATQQPEKLLRLMEKACGIRGVVRKTRTLFIAGRTRIHIDRVENLGDFLELEVVLSANETAENGISEAGRLMEQLGIKERNLVDCAYIDLIETQRNSTQE